MKNQKLLFSLISLGALMAGTVSAFETTARNALLMDYDTGAYLYVKAADESVPPASMSKLMTLYVIFDKLRNGTLSLEDKFTVSENAWRKGGAASGGSTMFLKIGEEVSVEDLLQGIIVQSGNDACIVAAENIAGTEEDFALLMNETAQKLGLKNSSFANATGLPDPGQRMSMEDLALLAKHIISEFPEYYRIFSEKNFTHNNIKQGNRNPLLYSMTGADGLKTGHTEEAGFCLTASALKGGRRLISAMSGMQSNRERSEEAERLMSYGFREFDNYQVLTANEPLADVSVWYGVAPSIQVAAAQNEVETIRRSERNRFSVKITYDEPVVAPVHKGDQIGSALLTDPEGNVREVALVAVNDVAKVGFLKKLWINVQYLLFGKK